MLLKADHVYKVFNGETLLSDICLQIEDTDRIGLIGANGCGKSTLLKILLGELLPDHMEEGDGQIVRAAKTSVGYLAQSAALDSEKTVREEMRGVFSELLEGKARMRELEHRLGEALRPDLHALGILPVGGGEVQIPRHAPRGVQV